MLGGGGRGAKEKGTSPGGTFSRMQLVNCRFVWFVSLKELKNYTLPPEISSMAVSSLCTVMSLEE